MAKQHKETYDLTDAEKRLAGTPSEGESGRVCKPGHPSPQP